MAEELMSVTQQADSVGEGEFVIDEAADEVLRLELDQFEGPFEVLLYLIKTQEIDIFDIPIVTVTEQYLRFLELMRTENLDVAGEFLVMAATLIQIKSRMILPVEMEQETEEEIEEEDPRLELVERLLEYRKFRDLGRRLGLFEEANSDRYPRLVKPSVEIVEDEEDISEVSLYDLVRAVRNVMRYIREPLIQHVAGETFSVEQGITRIENILEEKDTVTWTELCEHATDRLEIVCYFLAILELCRMRRVRAHQQHAFGEIRVFARSPEGENAQDVVVSG